MYEDLNDRTMLEEAGASPIAATPAITADAPAETAAPASQPAVVEEVLIEEVSIDGMCGVY